MATSVDWSNPPPPKWFAKQRNMVLIIVAVCVCGGVVGGLIGATHHHHRTARHHTSTLFSVVQLVVTLAALALIVIGTVLQRRELRRHGMPFWPRSTSLPRRARRDLGRAVRRGQPAADPDRRRYEIDIARRVVVSLKYLRFTAVGVGLIFVLRIIDPSATGAWRLFSALVLLVWLVALPFGYRNVRQARRFLDAAANDDRG